jgi:hypothetical protein
MMRMVAQLSVAGIAGVLLIKLLGALMFPAIGIVIGILSMLFKIALVMIVGYVILSLIKRFRRSDDDE